MGLSAHLAVGDPVERTGTPWLLCARKPTALVNPTLPSPMLQPYEVWDQDLFDREMVRVFARSWIWLGDTEDLDRAR